MLRRLDDARTPLRDASESLNTLLDSLEVSQPTTRH